VYPPIQINPKTKILNSKQVQNLKLENTKQEYYLMISRIVGGKGIMEAATAFKQLGVKLKIVGEVVDIKLGAKVEPVERVGESELAKLYNDAKGFVALARDEDFGMTVVESMLHGTPVLAYNGGGYRESVIPGKTGILINAIDTKSVAEGIKQIEKTKWDKVAIKKWAGKFGRDRFERKMRGIIKPLDH